MISPVNVLYERTGLATARPRTGATKKPDVEPDESGMSPPRALRTMELAALAVAAYVCAQ